MPNFDNQNAGRQYVPVASFSSIVRRINLQKRYILAILTSIGFTLAFAIRSNECTFKLDPVHLASSRGWGELYFMLAYFLIQIPSVMIINRFSPFKIFGLLILCSTVLGLGTPIFIRLFHHSWLMYIAFAHGLLQGAAFPAAQAMWQYWVPPIERSTIISIAFSGCFFGLAIGAVFSNLVCDLLPSDNVLIVYGLLGIVWFVLWSWSIYENPSAHPTITDAELQFLKQTIGNYISTNANTPAPTPWKKILGSKSTWALFIVLFCRSWTSFYLVQGDFAEMDFIHEYNVWFLSFPACSIAICLPIVGFLADLILTKTSKSVAYIRRLYICGGFLIQLLIFIPGIIEVSQVGPLVLDVLISCILYSCILCGFFTNHLDVAPKHAHVTMAVSNMISVVANFFIWTTTIVIAFADHAADAEYNREAAEEFFIIITIFHILGGVTYYFCGSGQTEDWSKPEAQVEDNQAVSFSNNSIGV